MAEYYFTPSIRQEEGENPRGQERYLANEKGQIFFDTHGGRYYNIGRDSCLTGKIRLFSGKIEV